MTELLVAGLSHHTAPLSLRERLALSPEELPAALDGLVGKAGFAEGLILSTCNRTEVYVRPSRGGGGGSDAVGFVESLRPELRAHVGRHLYLHEAEEAVRHLFRVAAGLDSMVVGEGEISRQMSEAYGLACAAGTAGRVLHRAIPRALQVGKRVRTQTRITRGIASVAGAAIGLADRVFRSLTDCSIVTVGAGTTVETALRVLRPRARGPLVVLNRTLENAERLASTFDGSAGSLAELPKHVAQADVVVCATAASEPLVRDADVAPLLKARRLRPLLLIDLGVPRDVEPALGRRGGVYLHDVDDLQSIAQAGLMQRAQEVPKAEAIVELAVTEFQQRRKVLAAEPAIRALLDELLRLRADVIRRDRDLGDADRVTAERVTGRLVDRIVRQLAPRLKDGTASPTQLLEAFGVDTGPADDDPPAGEDGSGGEA